jgi:hypothetical protein
VTYPQRVLLAGWFSFPDSKATFGDVQAMEVVAEWLRQKEMPFDVAGADVQGVDITSVDPGCYNTLIFVCGPWGGRPAILSRFGHCRMIGIDLSLSAAPHGFDRVFPRDPLGNGIPTSSSQLRRGEFQ